MLTKVVRPQADCESPGLPAGLFLCTPAVNEALLVADSEKEENGPERSISCSAAGRWIQGRGLGVGREEGRTSESEGQG